MRSVHVKVVVTLLLLVSLLYFMPFHPAEPPAAVADKALPAGR